MDKIRFCAFCFSFLCIFHELRISVFRFCTICAIIFRHSLVASTMSFFIASLLGPRVYHPYQPNFLESGGNKLFSIGSGVYNACILLSPILLPYCIFSCSASNYGSLCRTVATFYAIAFSARTVGRLTNNDYVNFIGLLERVKTTEAQNSELRTQLKRYDYQVFAAPVDFVIGPARTSKWFPSIDEAETIPDLPQPADLMRRLVAWIAASTFGRRMLYPGSMAVFHSLMNDQLVEGRRKLLEEKGGERNILLTEQGNRVDSVFVDKRGRSERGDTLVICCEGNAGYYEMGVMITPINLQYSVLGWNLPGFAESTGTPYPHTILSSMETVMQFAIQKLGFRPNQIVLYAWSIGGFPATWTAANYPDIRALILDASFDDLTPLATARMPSALAGLVRFTVQKHLNLPVAKQLNQYAGPVLLIRRWNDEIIVTEQFTDELTQRASNRANFLLLKLIRARHPGLLRTHQDEASLFEWLEKEPQERIYAYAAEDFEDPKLPAIDLAQLDDLNRRKLIRQLCNKYFVDFMDASHNVPLDAQYFNIPTTI